jgi:CTP synthase (UTP-ammonia lyase)
MRLGQHLVYLNRKEKKEKMDNFYLIDKIYGNTTTKIYERFRHRYEVNPKYFKLLEDSDGGLNLVGKDLKEERLSIIELDNKYHPFFLGVQYHPEYQTGLFSNSPSSQINKIFAPFCIFINHAKTYKKKLNLKNT